MPHRRRTCRRVHAGRQRRRSPRPPPHAAIGPGVQSNDAILKWINAYRHKPDPEALPAVVHALSAMQAFKDAENSGPYIGFVAGVLGNNPARAEDLVAKMLSIDPADHWVLVRAIAYSGLSDWKELLTTFADRMPTRRAMIDEYLDGKLPTLEQIDFRPVKPGMFDKLKATFGADKDNNKKVVALEPTPELIDVLWGYYLATGEYAPIESVIELLPLANDKDSVDNLTTGSAAKFTLASNAVRDTELLAMLEWAVKSQPKEIAGVLKDVIETAATVDTVHMRQESLAAIEELKEKGPELKARALRLGPSRPGRAVDGLRRRRGHRPNRIGLTLRARRRRLHRRPAIRDALIRHCEERSDEAIQFCSEGWIASLRSQ